MKTTLEQWRMFKAVVENGGFAGASKAVYKSQSSVHHAVHKLEQQLGVKLLQIVGRRTQLTDIGEVLLARGDQLLDLASDIEHHAQDLKGQKLNNVSILPPKVPHIAMVANSKHTN